MSTLKIFRYAARTLWGGALLAGLLLSGGCSQDDDPVVNGAGDAASFIAGITGHTAPAGQATQGASGTRTTNGGDSWAAGDPVGIFMLETGAVLPDGIIAGADNKKYTVTNISTGAMAPDGGTPLYYPQSGNVDFVAYYPYGATSAGSITAGTVNGTNCTYNISVAGQGDETAQNTLDVLYAKAVNAAKSKTAVKLAFGHVLSKVTLNVKAGEGIAQADVRNLAASSVVFGGMPQTATLDLQDGGLAAGVVGEFNPVKAPTAAAAYDATFTALIVPQAADTYVGRTMVFTVAGVIFTGTISDSDAFVGGSHYTYPVMVGRNGVIVGTPTITPWTTNDHGTGTTVELKDFVKIPAGTFLMGSPEDEPGRDSDEKQHWVTLSKDVYMSKYQVTNAQYAAFLNAKHAEGVLEYGTAGRYTDAAYLAGSADEPLVRDCMNSSSQWGVTRNSTDGTWSPIPGYEDHPVIYITWYGAKAYADYYGYRLPTEAQWEYACRAGTTTAYSYGDTADGDYMWYTENNTSRGTKAVGTKLPNPWGLYDMHGNVYEWCSDRWATYADAPTEDAALVDPEYISHNAGSQRVLRGGYWGGDAWICRSAFRNSAVPGSAVPYVGFRVAVVP